MSVIIERYFNDQLGSKAVDWAVLTTGAMMLAIALFAAVSAPGDIAAASDLPLAYTVGAI